MVAVLAFSCTACGTIGGPPSSDVENDTPVISTDFETYDVSTKDGLHDAVIHSPDYNTKDDFWYYFYGDKVYNYKEKALRLYSPAYFNLSSVVLGMNFTVSPHTNIEGEYPFYLNFEDEEFISKYTEAISEPYDGLVKEYSDFEYYYLSCTNNGVYDLEGATDTKLKNNPVGDEFISMDDFYTRLGVDINSDVYKNAEEPSIEVLKVVRNINNYNDWCKDNGFIYNYGRGNLEAVFTTENGHLNFYNAMKTLQDYTKNYLEAKYTGVELTTPVSKTIETFANADIVKEYLNKQNLTNCSIVFDTVWVNLETAYPCVYVQYTVTDNTTGFTAKNNVFFLYNIVKEADGSYDYEVEYILCADEFDTYEEARNKGLKNSFCDEFLDNFCFEDNKSTYRIENAEFYLSEYGKQ